MVTRPSLLARPGVRQPAGQTAAARPPTRLPLQTTVRGPGHTSTSLRGATAATDPYVSVEHFHLARAAFGPHPHAGMSSVTYLFEDAEGGLRGRDSLGGDWPIRPGDLHWTLAGRGLMHDERPAVPGRAAHGLQMVVNLPAAQKQRAPAVLRLAHEQMPQRHGTGWREVQVFGGAAPLALPVFAALRVLHLQAGAHHALDAAADGEQGFVLVISGHGRCGAETLAADVALALTGPQAVRAETTLVLAVFSGRPLREPVVQHGPFVMNTEAQIVAAMQRFQSGGMGQLAPCPASGKTA